MNDIVFDNVCKSYGKTEVIKNLNLEIESGKRVILLDCDLRKGSLASYLKISRSAAGISDVIDVLIERTNTWLSE